MDYSTWDRINEFTISSIVISCSQSVIHHVANCTHLAHAYWEALRNAFRPTDAQGALRLLTRFWGLSLTAATPEAFDLFSKDYKAALAAIKAADVKLETVFSSHHLNALPPALSAFQTSLAISNSSELPLTNRILELARNEILRISSPSSGLSVALAASSHSPPPAPCPACGKTHWLRDCPSPEGDKYRARQKRRDADRKAGRDKVKTRLAQASTPAAALAKPAAQLAALLGEQDGVEVWLSSADQLPRTGGLTLDSGATHSMCGDASLLSGLRLCRPSVAGGATFAEVEALYSAASDDLAASAEQYSLPTSDPRNHREAMHESDSERWRHGERDEFSSLCDKYNVFHLVDRSEVPSDAKILGSRFVYRRKKDQHGRITGFKVRLVAQGFTQRPNVDFRETFAPVAKFTSIRVLLALAARHRLHVHQADVDKAYLHGALE
ncbi:hypothetical protein JCM8202_001494, partial [Rhodotorula sphaerocarpa]